MTKREFEVYKFGGLSIANIDSINKVTEIIKTNKTKNLIIVFSAMGKTTRKLVGMIRAYHEHQKDARSCLQEITGFFQYIYTELNLNPASSGYQLYYSLLNKFKQSVDNTAQPYSEYYDQVICYGELISSAIMSIHLKNQGIESHWIDITGILKTDSNFGSANIDFEASKSNLISEIEYSSGIFTTQGFIASDHTGRKTSLGFEGSDYSAALIANAIDASEVTLWKDVTGVMSDDPKTNPDARSFKKLTYKEAHQLLQKGVKIIHPKTIQPLKEKNIPLQVRSFLKPECRGTIISD